MGKYTALDNNNNIFFNNNKYQCILNETAFHFPKQQKRPVRCMTNITTNTSCKEYFKSQQKQKNTISVVPSFTSNFHVFV